MRSSLNTGFCTSHPARSFERQQEEIEALNSRLRQAEERLMDVASRLSAIENKNGGSRHEP